LMILLRNNIRCLKMHMKKMKCLLEDCGETKHNRIL